MIDRRAAAARVVDAYVPSDYGDANFSAIINGRWSPGGGTTCSYLPALCLYLAGCRAPELVNFDDVNGGTTWDVGAGISKLVQGARRLGCWVDDGPGREPSRMDVAFISNGPPLTEHVAVVVDPSIWRDASAGQTNAQGNQAARIVDRQIDDQRATGGVRRLSNPLPIGGGYRQLQGWVSLDLVPWTVDPIGVAADTSITGQIPLWGWLAAGAVLLGAAGAAAVIASKPEHPLEPDAIARRRLLEPSPLRAPPPGQAALEAHIARNAELLRAGHPEGGAAAALRAGDRIAMAKHAAHAAESVPDAEQLAVLRAREAALLRAAGPMREHLAAIQAGPWGHAVPRSHVLGFVPEGPPQR